MSCGLNCHLCRYQKISHEKYPCIDCNVEHYLFEKKCCETCRYNGLCLDSDMCGNCSSDFNMWEPIPHVKNVKKDEFNILEFQAIQREWQQKNFPDAKMHQPLLGLAEEVGELSHAHLKAEHGIRGTPELLAEKKKDAIGDIFVYLVGYCNMSGFSLVDCINSAWEIVSKRDFVKFPLNGVTE